jgi:hypothetical protein
MARQAWRVVEMANRYGLSADEIPHQICGRALMARSGYDCLADLLSAWNRRKRHR